MKVKKIKLTFFSYAGLGKANRKKNIFLMLGSVRLTEKIEFLMLGSVRLTEKKKINQG